MIALFERFDDATGAVMPPRLSRLSKYALPSLPSATTRPDGVAPGTSTSNGPEPPRSLSILSRVEPIERRPVIGGDAAKDRARLEANHCFAATPVAASVESVTSSNERIGAITGDAADAPYCAAVGARWPMPSHWLDYLSALPRASHDRASQSPRPPYANIKNVAHDAERRSLLLDRCSEGHAVV